jgi:(R,R)-butanediol dehydrogenase / meso-butanediol dehydrogenase / diacetyl reductase
MLAVRLYAAGDLRVEEIAPPLQPDRNEVTLKVTAAGICGSDLHNFKTGAWITRAPSIAGHEFTGIVTAIGADVRHVRLGDRVLVDSRHMCGACPACRAGEGQVCDNLGFLGEVIDGGFAEAITLPGRNVLKAPEGVPDRHLALAEPLAVALHALNRLNAPLGATVVIAGCGPIGAFVALLASHNGQPVAVVDRNADRAQLVATIVGGRALDLTALSAERFRYAVETTGHDQVINDLVTAVSGCGTIALVGIGKSFPVIDPVRLVEREISLLGCHAFGDELQHISTLLPTLTNVLDAFIGEQITLHEVPAAFSRHIAGRVTGLKTVIRCSGASDE